VPDEPQGRERRPVGRPQTADGADSRSGPGAGAAGEQRGPEPVPLLQVSPPTPVGSIKGRYCVHIRRVAAEQPCGVTFSAVENQDKRLQMIAVADDLSHLGLRKGDQVLLLNGTRPRSIVACRDVLQKALSIVLVLQHQEPGDKDTVPDGPCACRRSSRSGRKEPCPVCNPVVPEPVRLLLSMTGGMANDMRRGEFRLTLHRTSLMQSFGLSLAGRKPGLAGDHTPEAVIFITRDLPHLGLQQGDRLIGLNGMPPRSWPDCRKFLERATDLSMTFRRGEGSGPAVRPRKEENNVLEHEIVPVEIGTGPAMGVAASLAGCGRAGAWCCSVRAGAGCAVR